MKLKIIVREKDVYLNLIKMGFGGTLIQEICHEKIRLTLQNKMLCKKKRTENNLKKHFPQKNNCRKIVKSLIKPNMSRHKFK